MFLRRDAEPDELAVPVAPADAEIEPTAGHDVDGRHLLSERTGLCHGSAGTPEPRRSVRVRIARQSRSP
jgi:hypothetical protein